MQSSFVVVGVAVAARVPGGRAKPLREEVKLRRPVRAVAADAVQEYDERPSAGDGYGDARRRAYEERFQDYSALAPEIFTARARLSLSRRI